MLYGLINVLAVRAYGEAEFWLSGGKVILIFVLFAFTFVTMVNKASRLKISNNTDRIRLEATQLVMPMASDTGGYQVHSPNTGQRAP